MVTNWFKINISNLKNDRFIRFDVDYVEISREFQNSNHTNYLKNYLTFIETGKSIDKEDYNINGQPSEYAHITVRNIVQGELNLKDLIYLNEDKGITLKNFQIEKGDILIAISSNVGVSCLVETVPSNLQLTLSHYIVKIKVDTSRINPKLLVYYLNSSKIKNYFRSVETGKTLKNLSKNYIYNLPISLPKNTQKQLEIVKRIQPIETDILKIKASIKEPLEIINSVFF
ncbi:restriction modification system DNA specificity domain protein [Gloeothece citriformis PCC 7424]|uniref:Restriction modification system DNA specificity domain protein n=1 Tax=Gloeothece citriformis (strain PCC 7424) TaxID=65393 RepID=B7KIM2_GLOC7|nr:restriction modification system DNA specificity domain-containing protein [Gloeothece citriformis]ACK69428.1 restriction modification system DNA specificity domain protein [Gloeothece citriformis PCC 7424]